MTGALIGAGAVLVGYAATAATSRSTTRASAKADRQARLWDKRVELYVDTITYTINRRLEREQTLSTATLEHSPWEEARAGYEPPVWLALRGRIEALASDAVLEAFEAAHKAQYAVVMAVAKHDAQAPILGRHEVRKEIDTARREAVSLDDALVAAIRAELDPIRGRRRRWRFWRRN